MSRGKRTPVATNPGDASSMRSTRGRESVTVGSSPTQSCAPGRTGVFATSVRGHWQVRPDLSRTPRHHHHLDHPFYLHGRSWSSTATSGSSAGAIRSSCAPGRCPLTSRADAQLRIEGVTVRPIETRFKEEWNNAVIDFLGLEDGFFPELRMAGFILHDPRSGSLNAVGGDQGGAL